MGLLTIITRTLPLSALVISACTVVDPAPTITQTQLDYLLRDELFPLDGKRIEYAPEDFLQLPAEYRAELDRLVLPIEDEFERYRRLRSWMYQQFEEFEFDVSETYSISDLGANRKINCLSFSTMFVAAARYAQVDAKFQLVSAPPYWDSANSTWINNQHINVTGIIEIDPSTVGYGAPQSSISFFNSSLSVVNQLGGVTAGTAGQPSATRRYTMDISPAVISSQSRHDRLDDYQVLSLYYSNKAIQALLDDDLNLTYAYTREALRTDADSVVAWTNLGVVYSRKGQLRLAEEAYHNALLLDGDAHSAQSNLASIYRRQGRTEEAATLEASVAELKAQNPYYHQLLADTAMDAGDIEQAIGHLEDAVALKHNEFLFYHKLAIAHQRLGNAEQVMENLVKARRHSRGEDRSRFSGKLQALRDLAAN